MDAESGVTHSLETSTAKVHDSRVWDELLHGRGDLALGRQGLCSSASARRVSPRRGKGLGVMPRRPRAASFIPERRDRIQPHHRGCVRAGSSNPFRILKPEQFGTWKTRYRGLARTRPSTLFTLFALGNLFLRSEEAAG